MPRLFILKTLQLKKEVTNKQFQTNFCSLICPLSVSEKIKAKSEYKLKYNSLQNISHSEFRIAHLFRFKGVQRQFLLKFSRSKCSIYSLLQY